MTISYIIRSRHIEQLLSEIRDKEGLCATIVREKEDSSIYAKMGCLDLLSYDASRQHSCPAKENSTKDILLARIGVSGKNYVARINLADTALDSKTYDVVSGYVRQLDEIISYYGERVRER